jgi:hypothetical protein
MPVTWDNGEMTITPDPPNPVQEAEEARAKAYRERPAPVPPKGTSHPQAAEFYERMVDNTKALIPD